MMQTMLNVGTSVLVTALYDLMDRAESPAFVDRPPSPRLSDWPDRQRTQTPPSVTPTPPRRITRRRSWDLPLGEYVASCCGNIVGLEGSPGINNHQANEQVFALQQRVIKALEHPDEEGLVDDRDLRRDAAALRARYRHEVAASEQNRIR
jgi:hypothetical protein